MTSSYEVVGGKKLDFLLDFFYNLK